MRPTTFTRYCLGIPHRFSTLQLRFFPNHHHYHHRPTTRTFRWFGATSLLGAKSNDTLLLVEEEKNNSRRPRESLSNITRVLFGCALAMVIGTLVVDEARVWWCEYKISKWSPAKRRLELATRLTRGGKLATKIVSAFFDGVVSEMGKMKKKTTITNIAKTRTTILPPFVSKVQTMIIQQFSTLCLGRDTFSDDDIQTALFEHMCYGSVRFMCFGQHTLGLRIRSSMKRHEETLVDGVIDQFINELSPTMIPLLVESLQSKNKKKHT